MMCWTSLQVRPGLASRVRATIPAAIGALALVPVCLAVQLWCRSVVTTCRSLRVPELFDTNLMGQGSCGDDEVAILTL